MPETRPPRPHSARARDSAVGQYRHKRSITDIGLAMLTPLVGQEFLDRYHLRDPLNRGLKYGVKQVFSAAGASTRQFKKVQGVGKPPTRLAAGGADYFDLTPDDDQKMIVETVSEFAEEILRPAARSPVWTAHPGRTAARRWPPTACCTTRCSPDSPCDTAIRTAVPYSRVR